MYLIYPERVNECMLIIISKIHTDVVQELIQQPDMVSKFWILNNKAQ